MTDKPRCEAKHPGGGQCILDDAGPMLHRHRDEDGREWTTSWPSPPRKPGICEVVERNEDGTYMVRMDNRTLYDLWSEFGCANVPDFFDADFDWFDDE